ncbi:hypothetical protein N7U66_13740 [Lacinutrix neustonica]|uniref:Uncharacterized protein n=1 Tax=Lacinutrix neustonica TaxID=2980107 RepID=A0A9E8SDH3_9FLAO|nr:hypothetical protein [Lacinutrix neustonica]WAC01189.1 hypothetical protein N7U66_13740 [Lacinutrix neustonica]
MGGYRFGIYKSIDAGVTWSNTNGTQGENMRDIKLKPGDVNTIYAVSSNRFWKSTDAGENYTEYNTTASRFTNGEHFKISHRCNANKSGCCLCIGFRWG